MKSVALLALLCTGVVACSSQQPSGLGLSGGRLAPCPDSPNCVSSQEQGSHAVEPLSYSGRRSKARSALLEALGTMTRVDITTRREEYIHAVFRSALFGFRDDVEFFLPADESIIHVRSASRTGWWDFGVNAGRVREIRERFARSIADGTSADD